MVEWAALFTSMTNNDKSVKSLDNDANLRLAGLLFHHQNIGETKGLDPDEIFPDPPVVVASEEAPR